MYLLDTCVCIELMRGRLPYTAEIMKQACPESFRIPFIVEAELLVGAEKSRHPRKTKLCVEQFLEPFQRIGFDSNCACAYSGIRAYLERKRMKIGPNDLLIASIAAANNATLITANVHEFTQVPGLRVENWEEVDL